MFLLNILSQLGHQMRKVLFMITAVTAFLVSACQPAMMVDATAKVASLELYASGQPSGYFLADSIIADATRAINAAAASGNDVETLRAQLTKLTPMARARG